MQEPESKLSIVVTGKKLYKPYIRISGFLEGRCNRQQQGQHLQFRPAGHSIDAVIALIHPPPIFMTAGITGGGVLWKIVKSLKPN